MTKTTKRESTDWTKPDHRQLTDDGSPQPIVGDAVSVAEEPSVDISIVCPFFNESAILAEAINTLLVRLQGKLPATWELIVVNDGSTDESGNIASEIAATNSNLRAIGYHRNRGRGHALRTGIGQARGSVIVTTEIDLSWGEDIVERLVSALDENPTADLVVASPHLSGGGYRNVPAKRVFLSRFGNHVIRFLMTDAASMNTGMTRAYRRAAIRSLPLQENGKEFHLEVILKAQAFGLRIAEIPALLEWKQYKHEGKRVKRKSSSKINKLMVTHSLFSLFAQPIRYLWPLSGFSMLIGVGFFLAGCIRFAMGLVSVYMLIISLVFAIISMGLFIFGVLAQQGNMLQVEMWRLRRDQSAANRNSSERDLPDSGDV